MQHFDLIIIGGGAGAFAAAIRANELKAKTALGETRPLRRGNVFIPFRASRGRIGRAKIGKFDIGAVFLN